MSDFIRAAVLIRYLDFANSQGIDGRALMREVGLPLSSLEQPDIFISYGHLITLLDKCAHASGNPLFGLEFGLLQGPESMGALNYLAQNCITVREALESVIRFFHLFTGGGQIRLKESNDSVWISYQLSKGQTTNVRQILEFTIGSGIGLMRTLCGFQGWVPQEFLLQTASGGSEKSYRRLIGALPQFGAAENAILVEKRWLGQHLTKADPGLRRLLQEQLTRLDIMCRDEFPARVVQYIRDLLPKGEATVGTIARYLGLSSRSLQRYLNQEDTSFQTLLDDTRRSLAKQYLSDSDIPIAQMVGLLGYTEQSNFSRAFARWFGCSPTEWLKKEGATPRRRLFRRQH